MSKRESPAPGENCQVPLGVDGIGGPSTCGRLAGIAEVWRVEGDAGCRAARTSRPEEPRADLVFLVFALTRRRAIAPFGLQI
jgi:hypothetical protein